MMSGSDPSNLKQKRQRKKSKQQQLLMLCMQATAVHQKQQHLLQVPTICVHSLLPSTFIAFENNEVQELLLFFANVLRLAQAAPTSYLCCIYWFWPSPCLMQLFFRCYCYCFLRVNNSGMCNNMHSIHVVGSMQSWLETLHDAAQAGVSELLLGH